MKRFEFELSTKIYFGTNIIGEALKKEWKRFAGKVLVVTGGNSLVKYGYLSKLIAGIESLSGNEGVVIYDKVTPNPKLKEVKEAIELGKKENVRSVIGFGGGSAIDAAKAAAAGIASNESIEECLLEGRVPAGKALPIIAIPTTAGTGSELSKGAIISSSEYHIKAGIRGEKLLPCIAIVDAAYTWSVSRVVTVETGFDVLAHAIESYMAVKANPFSEMFSEKAIRIVHENLPLLIDNLEDSMAREKMSFASMLMGINLANIGTCLPHRMQYAIGSITESSHAAGLIALYPSWIRYEFEVNPERIKQIFQCLGYQSVKDASEAKQIFKKLLSDWGIPYSLSECGIKASMVDELVSHVTGNLGNDGLSKKEQIVATIFKESI